MGTVAQTDSTTQKDLSLTMVLKDTIAKKLPPFSFRLTLPYQLANNNNSLYSVPKYQSLLSPPPLKYKGAAIYEIAGYVLLSMLAEKHYKYPFTPVFYNRF